MSPFDDAIEEMIESAADVSKNGVQGSGVPAVAVPTLPPAPTTTTMDYLTSRMEAAKAAQQNQPKTKSIVESVRQMRREYLYGLEHVHQLTDLEHAPDAILYGNFRHETSGSQVEVPKSEQ